MLLPFSPIWLHQHLWEEVWRAFLCVVGIQPVAPLQIKNWQSWNSLKERRPLRQIALQDCKAQRKNDQLPCKSPGKIQEDIDADVCNFFCHEVGEKDLYQANLSLHMPERKGIIALDTFLLDYAGICKDPYIKEH